MRKALLRNYSKYILTSLLLLMASAISVQISYANQDDYLYLGTATVEFEYTVENSVTSGGYVPPDYQLQGLIRDRVFANTPDFQNCVITETSDTVVGVYDFDSCPTAKIGASAFVISNGNSKIALVSLDTLGIKAEDIEAIHTRIFNNSDNFPLEEEVDIDPINILITATHTHNAPATFEIHGAVADASFNEAMRSAIVNAIKEANDELRVNIGLDKRVEAHFLKTEISSSPLLGGVNGDVPSDHEPDPEITITAFKPKNFTGNTELFFSYPTHHTLNRIYSYKNANEGISPGLFGLVAQELEFELNTFPQLNDKPTVAYFSGTSGGFYYSDCSVMVGSSCKESNIDKAIYKFKKKVLDTLSQIGPSTNILLNSRSLSSVLTKTPSAENQIGPQIRIRNLDVDETGQDIETGLGKIEGIHRQGYEDDGQDGDADWRDNLHDRVDFYLGCKVHNIDSREGDLISTFLQEISIGDLKIYGMPGEVFPQYGKAIKDQRSTSLPTMVFGLTNDYIGYVPFSETGVFAPEDEELHRVSLYTYQALTADHSYVEYNTGNIMLSHFGFVPLRYSANKLLGDHGILEGSFSSTFGAPTMSILNTYEGWNGWDEIFSLDYNADGNSDLLFWDKVTGRVMLFSIDSNFSLNLVLDTVWNTNWNELIVLDHNGDQRSDLLLWDSKDPVPSNPAALDLTPGKGFLLLSDPNAPNASIFSHGGDFSWSAGWDQVIALDYNGDKNSDLLFWEKNSGFSLLYKSIGNGDIENIPASISIPSKWDDIQPIDYSRDGLDDLVLWDKSTGETLAKISPSDETGNFIDQSNSISWPVQFNEIERVEFDSSTGVHDHILISNLEVENASGWVWMLEERPNIRQTTELHEGSFNLVREEKGLDPKWDKIIPIYTVDQVGEKLVSFLFWDKESGAADIRR